MNTEWIYESGVADNLDWASSSFDADGNLIIVGNVSVTSGNSDVLVTKFDSEGNMQWQETFDGSANGFDYGVKAVCDAANNTYVAAAVMGSGTEHDITVLKYDENGGLVWTGSWNGSANLIDVPVSMLLDPSGDLYVGGISHASLTNIDYALVKFGSNGQVLWSNTYDHAGLMEIPTGVELDISMNPVITGGSAASVSSWDFATVIYDQVTGAQLQVSRVATPGVGLDRAYAIAKDGNANLYITGYTDNLGNWDIQTIKLDASFNLEWAATWEGEGLADAAKAIGTDGDGNVLVTGYTANSEGGSEFITIKYDDVGNELWAKRFRPKYPTWQAVANKLVVDNDNNVLVTGTMYNGDDMDFWTVAYNEDGELLWAERYDGGNGDDEGMDIITDGQGNIFITGLSNTGSGTEYTTIKYSEFYKEENILYDGNGDPVCVDGELIIKFNPDLVDPMMVDDRGQQFAPLDKFVPMSVVNDICEKIGFKCTPEQLTAFKVFRRMTTADVTSMSRLGEQIPVEEFWSTLLITVEGMTDPFAVADSLSTMRDLIYFAHPNFIYELNDLPNDPLIGEQTSLIPTATYPDAHINADPAWDIQTGRDYVKVGVIDDGIYWPHEDFGDGTYAGSKITGGWNFSSNVHISASPNPNGSHGTACAGIIGALRNNLVGVAGIAGGDVDGGGNTGCQLISLDVSSGTSISGANAAHAIVEGSLQTTSGYGYGLHVLNCSWGGVYVRPEYV